MTRISVWAPNAKQVDLQLGDTCIAMQSPDGQWWYVETPLAVPGSDYSFRIDNGQPLPDPRSPWQPNGVHKASRLVDHAAFAWTDQGWQPPPLSAAVIYELHTGTFTPTGTFEAAIERLDHLVDLGITHVEIMPVAEFSGQRGWGYDGVDLYAPHHAYGGPDGLKRLVDACHRRGLAVLLDVVYNHFGPEGNYLRAFGPFFTDQHHTLWGEPVNLDGPDCDEVRRFFIDNARMWLRDYHIDGLRLDAVHALIDTSALHFLEALADEIRRLEASLGRHLVLIAESDLNDPRIIRPSAIGGYAMDAQWLDDFHHAIHSLLTGERKGYYLDFGSMADLAKSLQQAYVYNGNYSPFRRRNHGRSAAGADGSCFVVCMQNHDQVGNRAFGERISHLAPHGLVKIGAALVFAAPFVPMIFQGEEWAASTPFQYFTDHEDQQLQEAVKQGRRKEFAAFGWDPEQIPDPGAPETFERSKLKWEERSQTPHAEMLDWYRQLIQLRRATPDLRNTEMRFVQVEFDQAQGWFVLRRGKITVACNFSEAAQVLPLERTGAGSVLLASEAGIRLENHQLHLPGHSVAFLSQELY